MTDPVIDYGLMLLWGICWSIAYLAMIRTGFREKTYCMPAFALFFNISWEFIFAFIMPILHPIDSTLELVINIIWFSFDALIFGTYLLYGRKYFPKGIDKKWFLPWSILGLAVSFLFVLLISLDLSDYIGMYAAFISNLMMSVLFIDMLVKRGNPEGQSMVIAVFKCIGTMAPTIYFYMFFANVFILYLGVSCAVFDMIYIIMLYRSIKVSKEQAPLITVYPVNQYQ